MIIAYSPHLLTFHVWVGPWENCKRDRPVYTSSYRIRQKTKRLSLAKLPLANINLLKKCMYFVETTVVVLGYSWKTYENFSLSKQSFHFFFS